MYEHYHNMASIVALKETMRHAQSIISGWQSLPEINLIIERIRTLKNQRIPHLPPNPVLEEIIRNLSRDYHNLMPLDVRQAKEDLRQALNEYQNLVPEEHRHFQ